MMYDKAVKINRIFEQEYFNFHGTRHPSGFDIRDFDKWFVKAMERLTTGTRRPVRRRRQP